MSTTPKERPILFSAPMIRALLSGAKTMTRRTVKPQPSHMVLNVNGNWLDADGIKPARVMRCPYGAPGDRLWVRETCRAEELKDGRDGVRYLADDSWRAIENTPEAADAWLTLNTYRGKRGATIPTIHMPRWSSRLSLEIAGVRVEQAHQITDADVRAEGVDPIQIDKWRKFLDPRDVHGMAFGELWDSINGKGSWARNDWCWVVSFKVIGGPK